jgi:hypothetical protein
VPHSLAQGGEQRTTSRRRHELALFPLHAEASAESLDIRLRISGSGAASSIALASSKTHPDGKLSGYILDAREVAAPIQRFRFRWEQGADFLLRVHLDGSDDLQQWRPLVKNATLADLHHLGQHLQRAHIAAKAVRARYFRLRFADADKTVTFSGAQAEVSHDMQITHYQELQTTVEAGSEAGEYRFQIPPALPADELRIELPELNTLAGATLESRASDSQPWRQRQQFTLYRLRQNGAELENEEVPLRGARERYWRLRVEQSAGGLGAGLPQLSLRWRAHELRFVARGAAPYTLAWGNAMARPETQRQVPALLKSRGLTPAPAQIQGEVRRLAGDAALKAPLNWRQGLLWGVLLLATLLLVTMALRLFRQMNRGA